MTDPPTLDLSAAPDVLLPPFSSDAVPTIPSLRSKTLASDGTLIHVNPRMYIGLEI